MHSLAGDLGVPAQLEQSIPLTHFNKADRGGHFAAWEEPELFSEELRDAFRSLRQEGSFS
jgi:pimeloyl-ACP methyl ester carboxylesterase